jgi:hypothetical protein
VADIREGPVRITNSEPVAIGKEAEPVWVVLIASACSPILGVPINGN